MFHEYLFDGSVQLFASFTNFDTNHFRLVSKFDRTMFGIPISFKKVSGGPQPQATGRAHETCTTLSSLCLPNFSESKVGELLYKLMYRIIHTVRHRGWVDFAFGIPQWLHDFSAKYQAELGRQWEKQKSQPNPGVEPYE